MKQIGWIEREGYKIPVYDGENLTEDMIKKKIMHQKNQKV